MRVSISEAARVAGCHRQQLQRMIRDGRLGPPRLSQSVTGQPLLETDGLAEFLRGTIRLRIDSPRLQRRRAPEAAAPAAVAPPVAPAAEREALQLRHRLAEVEDREAQWIAAYGPVRSWVADGFTMQLWRALGDEELEIGQVLTEARRLVLQQLAELDQVDISSRAARSVRR